ncbi:MAG TPA: ATP-binding protein [Ignavibacteriaceae bacterium]|nr:ATP-binding protein [Ignavibacteriaceae bacterium]
MGSSGNIKNKAESKPQGSNLSSLTESQLSRIIDNLEGEFFWSSAETKNKIRREVFYSSNVKKITGYSGEDLNCMPDGGWSLIAEEEKQRIKKKFEAFKKDPSRKSITFIYCLKQKNGKAAWIKESITVEREHNGKIKNYYGIASNINDQKDIEEKLRKSEEDLRLINASKDKFISILSHDLRAPFTSILGFSEILLNDPELSEAEKQEYLNYIHQSSQNQLQLINYLLDWSKLQTGKLTIQLQRIHVHSLIHSCVSSLTGNAIRKNLEISVNANDTLFVEADQRLLTQVITNLLNNAIKFSNEYKTIDLFADLFNDEFVEFVVRDKGIGISEPNKSNLFKIDKIFSTEGTKGEKGTGLGLSLAKEIVEKHGGQIWFYSQKDVGSEFHFTIPISKNTILLVEDSKKERDRYEQFIKENFPAFNLVVTENGYEALNFILKKAPSLIITDDDMPLMSGIQLIQSVKNIERTRSIPFIAMISKSDEIKIKDYESLGVTEVLQKPILKEQFCKKVRTSLG